MDKKGIVVVIIIIVILLGLLGSCLGDNEYERAGKEFRTWSKKDPNTWTDTQKDYFDDLVDWSTKNK